MDNESQSNGNDSSESGLESWILIEKGVEKIDSTKRKEINDEELISSTTTTVQNETVPDAVSSIDTIDNVSTTESIDDEKSSSTEDECEICQNDCRSNNVSTFTTYANKTSLSSSTYRINTNSTYTKCEQQTRLNSAIILSIIAGLLAIILASSMQNLSLTNDTITSSHYARLTERVEKLETDNIALRLEISRLVDLIYRRNGDGNSGGGIKNEAFNDIPMKSNKKQRQNDGRKRVWLGDGPLDNTIPLNNEKKSPCLHASSDDLYSEYNAKKCESKNALPTNFENFARKAEKDFGFDPVIIDANESLSSSSSRNRSRDFVNNEKKSNKYSKDQHQQYKSRKDKENFYTTKGEYAAQFRPLKEFVDQNKKVDSSNWFFDSNNNQNKYQKQRKRDRKLPNIDDAINSSPIINDATTATVDSDWYAKMMKNREELRQHLPNGDNDQNWYLDRANERARVRTKFVKNSPKQQRYVEVV